MKHVSRRFSAVGLALLALLVFASAAVVSAQDAAVAGVITDSTKAVLPGVTVTATNVDTGAQIVVATDARGEYRLPPLPPGKYKIQAELSGFATVIRDGIELLVGQSIALPFSLSVGQLSETLVVVGDAPLVNTVSSQVAGNVDRRQMNQLPLQGRNWMELSKLVKGVTANDVGNSIGTTAADDLWQLNLDGQQITQTVADGPAWATAR